MKTTCLSITLMLTAASGSSAAVIIANRNLHNNDIDARFQAVFAPVPEPSAALLALLGVGFLARRRR